MSQYLVGGGGAGNDRDPTIEIFQVSEDIPFHPVIDRHDVEFATGGCGGWQT